MVSYSKIMKDKQPTYTLWSGATLIRTFEHNRNGLDAAFEEAYDLSDAAIYSSRDDLVWRYRAEDEGNECGMTDVEADADTLASAGYGTDEDYGYFGEDSYL